MIELVDFYIYKLISSLNNLFISKYEDKLLFNRMEVWMKFQCERLEVKLVKYVNRIISGVGRVSDGADATTFTQQLLSARPQHLFHNSVTVYYCISKSCSYLSMCRRQRLSNT